MGKTTEYLERGKEKVKRRSDMGKQEIRARSKNMAKRLLNGKRRR